MKRKLLVTGMLALTLSIILAFGNFTISGFVVSQGSYLFLNSFVVVFFLAGVMLIFVSGTLEQKLAVEDGVVEPEDLFDNFHYTIPKEKTVFVIDASFPISYSGRGAKEALKALAAKGTLIATDASLAEMRNTHGDVQDLLLKLSESPVEGYEEFKPKAREYLEQSRKNFYLDEVVPIILKEKEVPRTRREADKYMGAVRKVIYTMSEKGKQLTRENLLGELETHWKVSEADVENLAAAMAEVDEGNDAFVAERDIDFEDAIGHANMAHLHYLNSYGKTA